MQWVGPAPCTEWAVRRVLSGPRTVYWVGRSDSNSRATSFPQSAPGCVYCARNSTEFQLAKLLPADSYDAKLFPAFNTGLHNVLQTCHWLLEKISVSSYLWQRLWWWSLATSGPGSPYQSLGVASPSRWSPCPSYWPRGASRRALRDNEKESRCEN